MNDFEIRATQGQAQGAGFVPDEPEGDEKPKAQPKVPKTSVYLEGTTMPELQGGVLGLANEIPLVNKSKGNVDLYYKFGAGNMASAEAGIKGDLKLKDFKDGVSLSLTGETGVYGNVSFTQKAIKNAANAQEYISTSTAYIESNLTLPPSTPVEPGTPPTNEYDVTISDTGTAVGHAQTSASAESMVKIPANNFGAYADGGIKITGTTPDADVSVTVGAEVALQGKYSPITMAETGISTATSAGADGAADIEIGEMNEVTIVHEHSQAEATAEADANAQANAFAGIEPETKIDVSPKVKIGIQFGKGKKNGINVSASKKGFQLGYERKF